MTHFSSIQFSIEHSVARIILNRPDAANGINLAMAQELMQAAIACEQEKSLRAVLITGNGKMFSAGGDVKSFAAAGDNIAAEIRELIVYLHAAISQFTRLKAPVVIAVNGMAAGAGFSLAACGDIVLAAESAKFTMAYTAIGLSPDAGSSWHLPRLIGLRRTQELMLTNRRLSAQEACEWGIVTRVIADENLKDETEKLLDNLRQGPTQAYGAVKQLLLASFQNGLENQLEIEAQSMVSLANSQDGKAGINAFINKQAAQFNG